ncbi:hypothetical protein [Streptomyces hyaluromycini]|uniref:hypothetical protein n=1 Tax=Streptomyces hyaluromycini TaxID=1377993 RepID=UPI000B5CF38A|nr:hypothetical protein [Streptomyces hyaluromycini]
MKPLKPMKAAALVIGALTVAGAAAPAVAHGGTGAKDADLAGVVKQVTGGPVSVQPLQTLHTLAANGEGALPGPLKDEGHTVHQRTVGRVVGGL